MDLGLQEEVGHPVVVVAGPTEDSFTLSSIQLPVATLGLGVPLIRLVDRVMESIMFLEAGTMSLINQARYLYNMNQYHCLALYFLIIYLNRT